jgi:predicted ATP-grasp superfamily ATP-dependent carboligase
MQKNKQKVIVLGGDYAALGVIKAFAMEGIQFILLTPDPHDHACHSRFISQLVTIPNPMENSDGLLNLLMNMNEDWEKALLIPTLDEYVIFISQNRSELKKKYVFTVQEWEVTRRIIYKDLLYPHAQEIGVPAPRIFLPDSIEFLNERRSEFFYPCILKGGDTVKFQKVYYYKVLMVHDFQELFEMFRDTQQNNLKVMISEIIPGDDSTIFSYHCYIDSQGDVLAEMCTQKLRQCPTGFGQGSVVRTIPLIPEIRDQALKLLRRLSYYGEASTEFRLDYRDNKYKLMEINTRSLTYEWLFVKAGANFPYITYLDLVENIRTPLPTYRHGLYWIQIYWEIEIFIRSLRKGNLDLRKFLAPYWKKKVYAVPFIDDPIHLLIEIYLKIKRVLKKGQKSSFRYKS